jgi:hypothetical protein
VVKKDLSGMVLSTEILLLPLKKLLLPQRKYDMVLLTGQSYSWEKKR